MEIVPGQMENLPRILEIYRQARAYMAENGNPTQWAGGYPGEALIRQDIQEGKCFLCRENQEILGVFTYFYGTDPTYARIFRGSWLREGPSGVMHRVAVAVHGKGVAGFCFQHCFSLCGNLRIDTHRENLPMRRALQKYGFSQCGIIYLEDGQERLVFQKTEE